VYSYFPSESLAKMSWKTSGKLISGPPTLSGNSHDGPGPSSSRLMDRLRSNASGLNAYQRERQIVARYGDASRHDEYTERRTEWDVLKENHRYVDCSIHYALPLRLCPLDGRVGLMSFGRLTTDPTDSYEMTRTLGRFHGKSAWRGHTSPSCSKSSPW
jgi:hypothetical protein